MTGDEKREQIISFAYGNVAMENHLVTREMVAITYDESCEPFEAWWPKWVERYYRQSQVCGFFSEADADRRRAEYEVAKK